MTRLHAPNTAVLPFGDALAYEALMGRWSARLAAHFVDFCRLPGAGHVLDVGCGTGSLLAALHQAAPALRLNGIDHDLGFVAHAQARFASSSVAVEQGDACALALADGTVDATLSLLVLMALNDPMAAALEMRRVTRPDGVVAACTWKHEGLALSQVVWEEAVRLDPAAETAMARFRHCNQPGQLSELWRAAGLVDVVETAIEICTPFADFDDFWLPLQQGVGPGGAYLRQLAPAAKNTLRHALRARLLACGSDRAFSLRACALAVRGTVPGRG